MEKLEFKKIHNLVIDFLNEENSNELEILGKWYFRFLKSDSQKLSLNIPFYSKEIIQLAFFYTRTFTVVFNLLKQEKKTQFADTCLFDIFNESPQTHMNHLTLDFYNQKDNLALWGEDTLTKLDSFLPVFNKEKVLEFNKPHAIKNTFKLFRSIRNSGIIDLPLLIDLQEKTLAFNNVDDSIDDELISETLLIVDNNLDDDSAMELEQSLIDQELNNTITVRYPYSKKAHPYLIDVGKKRFNITFKNRFAYSDIQENDIFLLKDESKISNRLKYHIVKTNHSKDLYNLFKDFKKQWNNLELNKYTTPFPKYWFLLINDSIPSKEWLEQFKISFPAIAEKPIINNVEKIINELVDLNWIKKEIIGNTNILLPELKGLRKKRLEFVYNNFKNYIHTETNAQFINDADFDTYNNIIVLDSFNIIELVNRNQNTLSTIDIKVPDFLYFGYQPWIKYHLFNYQFSTLICGLREKLDVDFESNKEKIEKRKSEIIKEIKSELKTYNSNYKEEEVIELDEEPSTEDIEFSNSEEIENIDSESNITRSSIIINHNLEDETTILSSEKVLLQKGTLLYVRPSLLKIGDLFIRNSDISDLYKADKLYDRLVNIPSAVHYYQVKLTNFDNVYQILKSKGISYQHKNYFEETYVKQKLEDDEFRIPRRKKDWEKICELLKINDSIRDLSFIAYYGIKQQNELKKMYKSIIDLLLENNWIGTIEDPSIVTSVSEVVKKHNNIFNTSETDEISEISESVISTILDQLSFTEIKTLKVIANE